MLNNWLEGRQLSNFRVDEFLGRGGMAQVYRGWDLTLERPVAIKVIAAPFQEDPEYTARFLQEGRAMARWRHENIVNIYYAGQEEELSYLVMEYIEGTDLKAWLARYKVDDVAVSQEEILRIGKAVANALDYAHAHGIVHRDVKPSNILMADDGRILLTDFGLALDLQEGSSGEAFGSPKYIAPEQARSSADVVPQTDLYSLGIILYEMLTGELPFMGGSPTALAVQHLNQAPPLPRTINPALNEATEKVLLKCLRKSPDNRYQNGKRMMAALERALQGALNGEMDEADSDPVGPRTFSTVPVADMVMGHLSAASSAAVEDEAPLPPAGAVPPDKRRMSLWPAVGIGAVIVLFCLVGVLSAAFLVNRFDQNNINPGEDSNGTISGLSSEQSETQASPAASGENGSGEDAAEAPAPTVTLPGEDSGENRLVFFYNAGGFYAWNPGNRDFPVRQLSFEAVDSNGNATGLFFEGRRWAGYYPDIQVGQCDRLEILNDVPKERPGQCQGYNAIMTPEDIDPAVFWLPQENVNQFRVLIGGQEVGRCEMAAGQCEVILP
jgi:serine/threonine protein kinase